MSGSLRYSRCLSPSEIKCEWLAEILKMSESIGDKV